MVPRVLIVDDAIFMRNMMKDIFSMGNYDIVGEAANGLEAVKKFKKLRPDLVWMDVTMPIKSGVDASKEILAFDDKACIIICSALGEESQVIEAVDNGVAEFVVKPFKPEDVLRKVNRILKKFKFK